MQSTKSRSLLAALFVAGTLAGSLAVVGTAEAKRPQCYAVPVPGQPGTSIVICTTTRP
jgi:hypothetical protein